MLSNVQRQWAVRFYWSKKLEPVNSFDIMQVGETIRRFRGLFMRDGLPSFVPKKRVSLRLLRKQLLMTPHTVLSVLVK